MSGFNHLILSCCVLALTVCRSSAWTVNLPGSIKGLKDSCLVIPCSFDYQQNPPTNPDRVVWYQYEYIGYPLVYDDRYPTYVIDQFKGKTKLVRSNEKTCTLEIYPLTQSHHRQKIYPWVDPDYVGSSTYEFYHATVTIDVVDNAEKPNIVISGDVMIGHSVEVECSVVHTCPTRPPTLRLSIQEKSPRVTHESMSDGTTRTTLKYTMDIERDKQTVECSVHHTGGLSAKAVITLKTECAFSPLTISPASEQFLEGQSSTITCTASYTCYQHNPSLTWSRSNLQTSTHTSSSASDQWETVSTLKFTASANDHGKSLTCYANYNGGQKQNVSIVLRVKNVENNYNFLLPAAVGIVIIVIFGGCGVFMVKKCTRPRRNTLDEAQTPNNMNPDLCRNQPVHFQKTPVGNKCISYKKGMVDVFEMNDD